jgi:DivIVA domain-containing protein
MGSEGNVGSRGSGHRYDQRQVDAINARAMQAIESGSQGQRSAMAAELDSIQFRVVMRGFDRDQVGAHLSKLLQELRRD